MFQEHITGNKFLILILTGLLGVVLLSGCGHRGELTLPDTTTETAKQKKKAS